MMKQSKVPPQKKWVECRNCRRFTHHEILCELQEPIQQKTQEFAGEEDDFILPEAIHWGIIRCCGCESYAFLRRTEQDWDDDEMVIASPEYLKVYPEPQSPEHWKERFFPNIPKEVNQAYREMVKAYNHHMNLLCGIGVRLVIEGICNEKGFTGNLFEKINKMKAQNVLSEDHAKILHELRYQGNDVAHELKAPNQEELSELLYIIELTLHLVYAFPNKTHTLSQKRQRRKLKNP